MNDEKIVSINTFIIEKEGDYGNEQSLVYVALTSKGKILVSDNGNSIHWEDKTPYNLLNK